MASASGDLASLQDHIKRDPEAYRDDFLLQHRHFQSSLEIFKVDPSALSKDFTEEVSFVAHVYPYYKREIPEFPKQLCSILDDHAPVLDPVTRMTIVKSLLMLRNRNMISASAILPLLFKLFRCNDKQLRQILRAHIVSDIRKANKNRCDQKLNRSLQAFLREMIADPKETHASRHAIGVIIEMYRRNVWNDERTVNIVADHGLLHKDTKILVMSLQFFLSDKPASDDDDSDDESEDPRAGPVSMRQVMKQYGAQHAKKTRKRQRRLQKAIQKAKKQSTIKEKQTAPNFPALQMINDPQAVAEKVFGALKRSTERFEVRMMMMSFISRIIATHELMLLNFYNWMLRYLQPHQEHVTSLLAVVSQACHPLVPPDAISPVVKALADRFISDRSTPNVMTVGLNAVREICVRCPYVMDEDLLQDLVQYKKYRDKGVSNGAKSLLGLYREVDPTLLAKKDRGKEASSVVPTQYGQLRAVDRVSGADLLDDEGNENSSDDDGGEIVGSNAEERSGYWDDSTQKGFISLDGADEGVVPVEEGGDDDELQAASKQEVAVAPSVAASKVRILTDEDFERIDHAKAQQILDNTIGKSKRKRIDEDESELGSYGEVVDEDSILKGVKRRKNTYEDRIASVMAGREDRGTYGSKKGKERSSTTNREKQRNQPFMMVKQSQSVRSKRKRSAKLSHAIQRKHAKKSKSFHKK